MDATRATTADAGGGGGAPRTYKRDPKGSQTGGRFTANPSGTTTKPAPKHRTTTTATPKPLVPVRPHGRHGPMRVGGHNDPQQVRQLQALLGVLGLGTPPTNGEYDQSTEDAVRAAQQRLGLKPTGRATGALVNKLIDGYAVSPCVQRSEGTDPYDLLRAASAAGDFDEEEPEMARAYTKPREADVADDPNKPYGDVEYADPGYQDGTKRYPLDTEAHCRAAWSYINQEANAGKYSPEELKKVKARIMAAGKEYGIEFSPDETNRTESVDDGPEILRYERLWALDDIVVRAGGDGRTVEAYAAVFDTPTEIKDQHGHYLEVINRSAFNRAISHGIDRIGVFYHHGMTLHGTPSDLGSVPIGSPVEVRPDGRGLRTVSRFNKTALADSVLEAIRSGDIKGYSFRGRIYQSNPVKVPRARTGDLPTVTRHELGLTEYGPTPTPYYADAGILAVRSPQQQTAFDERLAAVEEMVRSLTPLEELSEEDPELPEPNIATPSQGPGAEDPPHEALRSAADIARRIRVAEILRGMK